MVADARNSVTRLLADLAAGHPGAADRLLPLVYDDLRDLARRCMRRERRGHTLQTTALVHEVYLRLVDQSRTGWEGRAEFLRVASKAMRNVLIDHARERLASKRGGGWRRAPLDEAAVYTDEPSSDVLALDELLHRLGTFDAQKAQVVELRFFGGLSVEDAARVLGISTATVKREWRMAKAWLRREIGRVVADGA